MASRSTTCRRFRGRACAGPTTRPPPRRQAPFSDRSRDCHRCRRTADRPPPPHAIPPRDIATQVSLPQRQCRARSGRIVLSLAVVVELSASIRSRNQMHCSCPSLQISDRCKIRAIAASVSRLSMASSLRSTGSESRPSVGAAAPSRPPTLAERFDAVRAQTEHLCEPLDTEDYVVSSMSDVSPTKWHLAHTSWFFETFVLGPHAPEYVSPNPRYAFLFNSYYVQAGERHCRAMRGLVTRPTVREVFEYRAHVNEAMRELMLRIDGDPAHPAHALIELGLHHEQQHQELLVTDIKHVFWMNPLRPVYRERAEESARTLTSSKWKSFPGGVQRIGHQGNGFAFDNEGPAHREFLEDFKLASRLVTNGEYLDFIDDGGYERSELWLSPGLAMVQDGGWEAPFYLSLI